MSLCSSCPESDNLAGEARKRKRHGCINRALDPDRSYLPSSACLLNQKPFSYIKGQYLNQFPVNNAVKVFAPLFLLIRLLAINSLGVKRKHLLEVAVQERNHDWDGNEPVNSKAGSNGTIAERIQKEIEKILSYPSGVNEGVFPDLSRHIETLDSVSAEWPFPIMVMDKIGLIVFSNEQTSQSFGYSKEDIKEMRFSDLWDLKLRKIPQGILNQMNQGLTSCYSSHLVLRDSEGNSIPCQVSVYPLWIWEEKNYFLFTAQMESDAEIILTCETQKDPQMKKGADPFSETTQRTICDDVENNRQAEPDKTTETEQKEEAEMGKSDMDEPLVVIGSFPWGEESSDVLEDSPKPVDRLAFYGFPAVKVRSPQFSRDPFLLNMISIKASDIHLKAGFPPLFRLDNLKLHVADNMDPLSEKDIGDFLIDLLGRDRFAEVLSGREIDFVYASENGERFRMNAFLSMGLPSLSVRHIKSVIPPMDKLGLPSVMKKLAQSPRGLILVTGPTGSGKSTTLASILEDINLNKNVHIITLEDPVEYLFHSKKALINQRQIGKDAQSFHQALSKVLRQDPDIIMVGEMRDLETISLAVTAAETGHLVLATLHTKDAPGSIDRIVDVFPAAQQDQIKAELSNTLIGICSQQLLPKLGGGRILATEMLVGNNAVRNRIRVGGIQHLRNIMLTSPEIGMHTLEQSLAKLVKKRLISYDTAEAHASEPKDLKRFLES